MQPTLAKCLTTTYNFDLWMSKGAHDVFVVVVNFLSTIRKPKHITIGLFEVSNTSGAAMVMTLKQILDKFGLCQGQRLQPINLCSCS
jgi:ubiquinone biosynthesis protein Coq4